MYNIACTSRPLALPLDQLKEIILYMIIAAHYHGSCYALRFPSPCREITNIVAPVQNSFLKLKVLEKVTIYQKCAML